MGYITELEAVNHMLLMAGESTVSDLTLDGDLDTEVALLLLKQFKTDYLMRGTVGNRKITKHKLATDGRINLDQDVLAAELISYHTNDNHLLIHANIRGYDDASSPYLWNITDSTDTWKAGTEFVVETIESLAWIDLDTTYQRAIMSAAARQYQLVMQGDADADAYLGQMELYFKTVAKGANADDKRRHVFSQVSLRARRAVDRSTGLNDPSRFRYWRTNNG
jgi:hypothetical protein